ncbi:expressed unknown protein [Seminavis robusta]|uniref:BACK domain-containing protein n=1 Tax=Seminavis robusta TaxID=568900 RepID=A0A9N8EGE9_9STRA|nr:expressed unknown protein [Seminavis robusta]|eukprot:Sro1159_g247660.1 n/a (369) ;mRNA; r:33602-34795
MLLGAFAEANSDVIHLDYKGCVLKALVEYIVTNSPGVLRSEGDGTDEGDFVSLIAAAMFFELPDLCEKVFNHISHVLSKNHSSLIAILEACQQEGPAVPAQLKELAVSCLVLNMDAFDMTAISLLSADSLEELLKCDTVHISEFRFFELVSHWANQNQEYHGCMVAGVKSSGLVPPERLLEAFEKQSMTSKEQHSVVFNRARGPVVWKNSLTTESSMPKHVTASGASDFLEYPPISCGRHEWTLDVVEKSQGDWIGMAIGNTCQLEWLGNQEGGWALGVDGRACHNKKTLSKGHPRFKQGSRVTLTLNLLPNEERNGTLCASIDDGKPFIVFENLRDELHSGNGGFVPAVWHFSGVKLRLVQIKQLED